MMKAVVVEASPKREGNSVTLAKEFSKGLQENKDSEITELYLEDLDIKFCRGCWSCLRLGQPGCVIDDDMGWIYPRLNGADVIVFATPIYWWHINAQMKKFIDRLEGLLDGNGPNNLSGRTLVLILTYIAEDPDGVYLAIQMFKSIAAWAGMDLKVIQYNSVKSHVKEAHEKLREVYELGYSLRDIKRHELTVPCVIEGCKGLFSSTDALARHLASGAGPTHSDWRKRNGFEDLGMRTDELWMGIAEKIRGSSLSS
ncbi:flavodoxin family protein [Candidatus Bathyarchaeota archaeon]|nr:MAG: flavodoxin family protein [Candidatus Bathyarchaeota archaeon]